MLFEHDSLVWFAKTIGLFYLIAMSICVVVYACSPSRKNVFSRAAKAILEQEDEPWR